MFLTTTNTTLDNFPFSLTCHQCQEVKGYMDAFLIDVDRQTAVIEQSNRPELKQREADKQYQGKVVNEYLDNGNDARLDLIPQKNYRGIRGKLQEFMGALGF
jgi:hypothetical protein